MPRSLIGILMGALVLSVLLCNIYVLISLFDSARILQTVEQKTGLENNLDCYRLYEEGVGDYYYPDRAFQGDLLFMVGVFYPIWVIISLSLPLLLIVLPGKEKRWRWLSLSLMIALLIAIGLNYNLLIKISCVLD